MLLQSNVAMCPVASVGWVVWAEYHCVVVFLSYSGREGRKEPDLVPAKIANTRAPQEVIRFYESKLSWHDSEDVGGES